MAWIKPPYEKSDNDKNPGWQGLQDPVLCNMLTAPTHVSAWVHMFRKE